MIRIEDSGRPNREFALARYRKLAVRYDLSCQLIEPVRHRTIDYLGLRPGETVIDVASGTGLSLPMLSAAVDSHGHVIAIELSPAMAAVAAQRIDRLALANVTQIVAPIEEAAILVRADALLFHYTHDVLRSPTALANLFRSAKPEARLAIAGFKLARDWRRLLNAWHRWRAWGYLSTFEGAYAPWDRLLPFVTDFRIHEENILGSGYIATARVSISPSGIDPALGPGHAVLHCANPGIALRVRDRDIRALCVPAEGRWTHMQADRVTREGTMAFARTILRRGIT